MNQLHVVEKHPAEDRDKDGFTHDGRPDMHPVAPGAASIIRLAELAAKRSVKRKKSSRNKLAAEDAAKRAKARKPQRAAPKPRKGQKESGEFDQFGNPITRTMGADGIWRVNDPKLGPAHGPKIPRGRSQASVVAQAHADKDDDLLEGKRVWQQDALAGTDIATDFFLQDHEWWEDVHSDPNWVMPLPEDKLARPGDRNNEAAVLPLPSDVAVPDELRSVNDSMTEVLRHISQINKDLKSPYWSSEEKTQALRFRRGLLDELRRLSRKRAPLAAATHLQRDREKKQKKIRASTGANIPDVRLSPKGLRQVKQGHQWKASGKIVSAAEAKWLNAIGEAYRADGDGFNAVKELFSVRGRDSIWHKSGLGDLSPDQRVAIMIHLGEQLKTGNVVLSARKKFTQGQLKAAARELGFRVVSGGDRRPVVARERLPRPDPTGEAAIRRVQKGKAKRSIGASVGTALRSARAFKESLHPRDKKGRFAHKTKTGEALRPHAGDPRVKQLLDLKASIKSKLPPPPKRSNLPAPPKRSNLPAPPQRPSGLPAPPPRPKARGVAANAKKVSERARKVRESSPIVDSKDPKAVALHGVKHIKDGGKIEDYDGPMDIMDLAAAIASGKHGGEKGVIKADGASGDVYIIHQSNGTSRIVKESATGKVMLKGVEALGEYPSTQDLYMTETGDVEGEVLASDLLRQLGAIVPDSHKIDNPGGNPRLAQEHAKNAVERLTGKKVVSIETAHDFSAASKGNGRVAGESTLPKPPSAGGTKIENRKDILSTAISDFVLGNGDRHSENYMIAKLDDGTHVFVPIDSGMNGLQSVGDVTGFDSGYMEDRTKLFGFNVSMDTDPLMDIPDGATETEMFLPEHVFAPIDGDNTDPLSLAYEIGIQENFVRNTKSRGLLSMIISQYDGDLNAFHEDLQSIVGVFDGMDVESALDNAFDVPYVDHPSRKSGALNSARSVAEDMALARMEQMETGALTEQMLELFNNISPSGKPSKKKKKVKKQELVW